MQEKKKKAGNIKLKKKLLNSFLIIWHFLIFKNIVLHTQKNSDKITQSNL